MFICCNDEDIVGRLVSDLKKTKQHSFNILIH